MCAVLISYCVCRRPSWTPKTQPNDSAAVVWLSFWCSTRFTRKKVTRMKQLHFFCDSWDTFDMSNRVEHQKLQPGDSRAATWLSFWCSTRSSADTGTDYYLHGFLRQMGHFFSSKPSWTPKTQPKDALSTDGDMIGYFSVNCICRRPSWTPESQPNGAVQGFLRQMEHFLSKFSQLYENSI